MPRGLYLLIGSAIDQVRVDPELRKSCPLSELLAPLLWGVPRSREWTLWELWLRRARDPLMQV